MKQSKLDAVKAKYPNCKVKLRANGSLSIALKCPEKSLTQQEFKDEVNINKIMTKYKKTGIVTHIMQNLPMFDDVSEMMTLQDALNLKISADANFKNLPSKLRARFGNDVTQLIAFLDDNSNYEEAAKLGLIDKKITPNPKAVTPSEPISAPAPSEPVATPPE